VTAALRPAKRRAGASRNVVWMGNPPSTVSPTERRQRITEVCELAAKLRPDERDAFVSGQCKDDEQLLQEVKAALPEYLHTDGPEDSLIVVVNESSPPPPPMSRIGRYEVTGTIGSGGSGQVYSAFDRTVGRVVAIKVLNAPGDPDLVRRFQAEAKTVANLHHKNIVTVHEYGEENGVPFLVMEYLKGTTLQELIRQGSLSLLEKLEIMSEVAEGLHYAHERGITHRDVKPANIMQLTDGAVKIMDFGIARFAAEGATRLTQTGLLIGSIMYMAPEQFSGTADALTDVFGYGVTFYELLTGENPFSAKDPIGIIFKIANTDPPPVSATVPECPQALDRIIARTLAREREARYSSLSDVLADTGGILSDLRRDQAYTFYREADDLFNTGQLDAARLAVRKVLRLDPAQEDARRLRSEIEETLRQRDAAARAQSLMDQAEEALAEQQVEEAAALLQSIGELGIASPDAQLQGRFDWAVAQVERCRQRDRLLNEGQRNLRNQNLTAAFRAVSDVLAQDPGSSPARDLLQEIRNRMSAREASRRLEAGVAEINDLLKNGLFDQAAARVDQLAALYPDADSPEHQELQALRAQASEQRATQVRQQIAQVVAQAETLIARQEFDQAVALLEAAIRELGDDFDLSRLLLQAAVARHAAVRHAPTQELSLTQIVAAPETTPEPAAIEDWRDAIGKLGATLGPIPASPNALAESVPVTLPAEPAIAEIAAPPASSVPEQREQAIAETPADRVAPPPRRKRNAAIWIVAGAIIASILILLLVTRPQFSLWIAKWHLPLSGGNKLSITDPAVSRPAVRGSAYSSDLQASGGSLPISWQILGGSLPQGLSLDSGTGHIAGMPVTSGVYSFQVKAADSNGHSAERALTIEVVEAADTAGTATQSSDPGQTAAGGTSPNQSGTGAIPPTCKSSTFSMGQFGDLLSGDLVWTGALATGGQLEIRNRHASPGSVQGEVLPRGVPVRLFVTPPRVRVVTGPTAENCWDPRLVLENNGEPKSQIRIQWEVFQP
jgi:predicted Ser/Thr protein kinase